MGMLHIPPYFALRFSFPNPDNKGIIKGFTSNYIKIRIKNKTPKNFAKTIQKVKLTKLLQTGEMEGILKT